MSRLPTLSSSLDKVVVQLTCAAVKLGAFVEFRIESLFFKHNVQSCGLYPVPPAGACWGKKPGPAPC